MKALSDLVINQREREKLFKLDVKQAIIALNSSRIDTLAEWWGRMNRREWPVCEIVPPKDREQWALRHFMYEIERAITKRVCLKYWQTHLCS